jgi:hypothetical protein
MNKESSANVPHRFIATYINRLRYTSRTFELLLQSEVALFGNVVDYQTEADVCQLVQNIDRLKSIHMS